MLPATVYVRLQSCRLRCSLHFLAHTGMHLVSSCAGSAPLCSRICRQAQLCGRYFNPVQSEAFPLAFQSNSNLVVAAPTGSGKTGVMELAILRLMANHMNDQGQLHIRLGAFKAMYLAPTRALVQVCTNEPACIHVYSKSLRAMPAELTSMLRRSGEGTRLAGAVWRAPGH